MGGLGGRVDEASLVIGGMKLLVNQINEKTNWKSCNRSWGGARGDRRVNVVRNDNQPVQQWGKSQLNGINFWMMLSKLIVAVQKEK